MAFKLICDGFQERKLPFRTINLSGTDHMRAEGGFSFRRLAQLVRPFCKAFYLFFSRTEKSIFECHAKLDRVL